ncbi:hypothetical protein ACJ5H2_21760 (plasmid) [Nocardioides sp. R1-1]|uniref:hypothetical protein n=1 Tax=Nocardioides sp. R1-1 TaxID=3383502 RepID=UPI0038D0CA04
MSRRQPMEPVEGLKKPQLPPPLARPRTLAPVPPPRTEETSQDTDESPERAEGAVLESVAAPQEATPAEERARPRSPRPRKPRPEKATTSPRSADADTMKPVSVSVPLTLAEAWRDRAKLDRTSQVNVLLDAIVAHQSELDDLVAASTEKPTINDGLFDRGPGSKGERFVGVSLRIKSGNLDVIDRLAEKHGPVKRSPFVAAVLTAYLT